MAKTTTTKQPDQPNILVIWGDDIGMYNVSAYHRGMMGGSTPNIDRIADEGVLFTDHYAQQSCTAGRASFIMGHHPFRTGMLTIGMPGSKQGIQAGDITIAEALKPLGYMTAQIGKNHLGDRNEYLPTVHGFDEFYGNLYHLNSEEEPEDPDYPKDPKFHQRFGPRGVLKAWATEKNDTKEDPRWGRVGKQRIEDTGPLNTKRMETVEDDLLAASLDFIGRAHRAGKPFFLWHSSTRCHVWTHLSRKWKNKTGYGLYADGMAELDHVVGQLLKKLDDLGIAENTIVVFSTDNGAEVVSWPDGGNTPFKGEKGTTWEGGFGYDQTALLTGRGKGARNEIFYFDSGGNLNAVRYQDWKIHFCLMEGDITQAYRKTPSWPVVVNVRQDPFERFAFESRMYLRWMADKLWCFLPAQAVVGQFLATFQEFPPSQKSDSLSVDQVLAKLSDQQSRN
jgi:arylsulfatase